MPAPKKGGGVRAPAHTTGAKQRRTPPAAAAAAAATVAAADTHADAVAAAAADAAPHVLIVESPAKARKISGFLGAGWRVVATQGHVRALTADLGALGAGAGWTPTYEELRTKAAAIAAVRSAITAAMAAGAPVLLASDDDREGEAIAAHVCALCGLDPGATPRVVFHEITEAAVRAAISAPRRIDTALVDAQTARAMLDMLVGFTVSRSLWSRVGRTVKGAALSAGRCQSPALRLVADKERAISGHATAATWRAVATTRPAAARAAPALPFRRRLAPHDRAAVDELLGALHTNDKSGVLRSSTKHVATAAPPAPLTTSALQQLASSAHGLRPKDTMSAAQRLYEGGHITYMRTDNATISASAATALRAHLLSRFAADMLGPPGAHTTPAAVNPPNRGGGTGGAAQPSPHEAIRPTHAEVEVLPADGDFSPAERRVYALVWRRAAQSQMATATTEVLTLAVAWHGDTSSEWDATLSRPLFAGWRALEPRGTPAGAGAGAIEADDNDDVEADVTTGSTTWSAWARVAAGAHLSWSHVVATEGRTPPPPRYTEASLVRELEKRGIGRPSTFASIVATLFERDYVERGVASATATAATAATAAVTTALLTELTLTAGAWPPAVRTFRAPTPPVAGKLRVTPLGASVAEFLAHDFGDLLGDAFTADMEAQLDAVAQGAAPWREVLTRTWDALRPRLPPAVVAATLSAAPSEQGGGKAGRPKAASTAAASGRVRDLGDGIKVVLSARSGPLLVREAATEGDKATFAPLPPGSSFESVDGEAAVAAFAAAASAKAGVPYGELDGAPVTLHVGRFGRYVVWRDVTASLKARDDEAAAARAIRRKAGTTTLRTVGTLRVNQTADGGAYVYDTAVTSGKPVFVAWPSSAGDPATATEDVVRSTHAAGTRTTSKRGRAGAGAGAAAATATATAATPCSKDEPVTRNKREKKK